MLIKHNKSLVILINENSLVSVKRLDSFLMKKTASQKLPSSLVSIITKYLIAVFSVSSHIDTSQLDAIYLF